MCSCLVSSGSFSVGFNFQYWENRKFVEDKEGKKKLNPYYVDKKYNNLKEEILNYQYLNFGAYQKGIIKTPYKWDEYKISKGDIISQEMLI